MGFRLRYDFKFETLGAHAQDWLRSRPDDALLLAFAGFAALWFANHIPDQAERIIRLSDQMISQGEEGANLYYWRAYAFRRELRINDTLESIDIALDLHQPGMNLVHQDYVRERAFITASQLMLSQISDHAQRVSGELKGDFLRQVESVRAELMAQSDPIPRVVG